MYKAIKVCSNCLICPNLIPFLYKQDVVFKYCKMLLYIYVYMYIYMHIHMHICM